MSHASKSLFRFLIALALLSPAISPSVSRAQESSLEDLGFDVESIDVDVVQADGTDDKADKKNEENAAGNGVVNSTDKKPDPTAPPIDDLPPKKTDSAEKKFFQVHGVFGAAMVGFKTPNGLGKEMSILASDLMVNLNQGGFIDGELRVNLGGLMVYKGAKERMTAPDSLLYKKFAYGVFAQAKAAHEQYGVPLPTMEKVAAVAQDLTNKYVDEQIDKNVLAEGMLREFILTFNREGRVEVKVGKMDPVYFKSNPWSHHRISSPGVRVTTRLTAKENPLLSVKLYAETYDSRGYRHIGNFTGSTKDYVAHHLTNSEPGSSLLSYRINESKELGTMFGIAKNQFIVSFGQRGDSTKGRYALFQYDGNPLAFRGGKLAKLHVNFQTTREGITSEKYGKWTEGGKRSLVDYTFGKNDRFQLYYWDIRQSAKNPVTDNGFKVHTPGLATTVKTWNGGAKGVKLITEGGWSKPASGKYSPAAVVGFVSWF